MTTVDVVSSLLLVIKMVCGCHNRFPWTDISNLIYSSARVSSLLL